ncbi:MAG TPA: phytoene desaturase family protein [Verrucomicrobiae bacterium]|nr:phytoene desaturase family protein [Verrucomicrobiae bacterium]
MTKHAIIIGAGIGGLGTACLLAKAGWRVTVLEKNEQVGGRAGKFTAQGFTFDTGPSWYLMPEVFQKFFALIGEDVHDHLTLHKLSPSYRVFFKDQDLQVDMWGDAAKDRQTFESIQPGAGKQLDKYLARSSYIYKTAMDHILYKNTDRVVDFLSPQLALRASKLSLFSSMNRYVHKYFKDPRLQQLMQYQLAFLGASPYNAPALYSLMSHIDYKQGVYYPEGGLYQVIRSLEKLAKKHGTVIHLKSPVEKIIVTDGKASGVIVDGKKLHADVVISNADPHHTEHSLLQPDNRDHSEAYWASRTLAPSALLMYLGVNRRYDNLQHHSLVFSKHWYSNFRQLYNDPQWPTDPSFYVCAPSRTDPTVAPKGMENLFVIVPVAAALDYAEVELEEYADMILHTMQNQMNLPGLHKSIVFKRLFAVKDFEARFNSLGGTSLGLAHTLRQTGPFRPSNKSKKVQDLYYVGANVHPGIGLPTCLISAQLVAARLI